MALICLNIETAGFLWIRNSVMFAFCLRLFPCDLRFKFQSKAPMTTAHRPYEINIREPHMHRDNAKINAGIPQGSHGLDNWITGLVGETESIVHLVPKFAVRLNHSHTIMIMLSSQLLL